MLQKTLSVWLCFSLCTIAYAQDTFLVKGAVFNANTLLPIDGASISGSDLFSITSSSGHFTFKNVKQGVYSLTVSSMGYTPKVVSIDVCPELKELVIYLEESTTNLDEVELHGKSKKGNSWKPLWYPLMFLKNF
ncbi:carboxypeptidase-like regulatory domain-containing protein [Formosa haliotis]|uniref:carboxypeptidase-like regulatory domain-containing protein n=1 Tax=Formosa haliotis TaxID=1555194 RepID=UPI001F262022|nr:carboxypeptidase-like regulatory domain-containing protein [Formosa haliotis]